MCCIWTALFQIIHLTLSKLHTLLCKLSGIKKNHSVYLPNPFHCRPGWKVCNFLLPYSLSNFTTKPVCICVFPDNLVGRSLPGTDSVHLFVRPQPWPYWGAGSQSFCSGYPQSVWHCAGESEQGGCVWGGKNHNHVYPPSIVLCPCLHLLCHNVKIY